MASIPKEQALALADGFIDSQGSNETFTPRNTISEVFLIASEVVEDSQDNLSKQKKVSSGNLSGSIAAVNPKKSGSVVSMDIEMAYYGLFVNSGVRGTKSGTSTAGYSFKNDFPSKKMVSEISKWIERGHISTRNVRKYSAYGRHESKQRSVAEIAKSAAYAIARSVKQKGLEPTGFFDNAISKATKKYAQRLGAALKIDIITTLTK